MIDTHCHLDVCEPPDAELVGRAVEHGVHRLATVGMDGASIGRALEAARTHPEVFAIVGRHPNASAGFDDRDADEIERAATDPLVRAIGETGLDFYRDASPPEDQRRAFLAQIEIARRVEKPLVIHTRAAEDETFRLLAEHAGGVTVILHCFSAPQRVGECVERGYVCSFAGNLTYPRSEGLRVAAGRLPEELLLVETDAPFLAPQGMRGKPNEPANVVHTAEKLAGVRDVAYEELDEALERNAARLFGW